MYSSTIFRAVQPFFAAFARLRTRGKRDTICEETVGYPVLLNPVLKRYAAMFGQTVRTVDADGMERTHMEGLRSMMNLLLACVLDI